MNVDLRSTFFYLTGIVLSVLLPVSCTVPSSDGPTAITKVNPYHFNTALIPKTDDRMIRFEHLHRAYGAIDVADLKARFGNYFTVYWKTDQRDIPATVRLDYRQANTGPKILTTEIVVSSPKRKNSTEFQIVGDDYATNGPVTQWKASIVQNGTVITEYRSFLWK